MTPQQLKEQAKVGDFLTSRTRKDLIYRIYAFDEGRPLLAVYDSATMYYVTFWLTGLSWDWFEGFTDVKASAEEELRERIATSGQLIYLRIKESYEKTERISAIQ